MRFWIRVVALASAVAAFTAERLSIWSWISLLNDCPTSKSHVRKSWLLTLCAESLVRLSMLRLAMVLLSV